MGKYDFELDMNANDTNPIIIGQIKQGSKVLEFGPAMGRMTKYLHEQLSCNVDIVEMDEESGNTAKEYANDSCIGEEKGNIENFFWRDYFKNNHYDYMVFADVLEHLSNPKMVIQKCKDLLKEDGQIIVSVPNLAHNAVLANLLKDEFEYQQTGLLDVDHIHFFTYRSIKKMVTDAGLYVVNENAVYHGIEQTEFPLHFNELDTITRRTLSEHTLGNVYQFVFTLSKQNLPAKKLMPPNTFSYFCKIFYIPMDQEDFCEQNSIVTYIDPTKSSFSFPINKEVKAIRIDPINASCAIRIERISLEHDGKLRNMDYVTNGVYLEHSNCYYSGNEFQVLLKDIKGFVDNIKCDLKFMDYEVPDLQMLTDEIKSLQVRRKNEAHDCRKKVKVIEKENDHLQNEINNIVSSRSWRLITKIKKLLRR